MKKILTVCILIIAVCLLSAGTVFADTSTGGQTFYIANENITVYVVSNGEYQPAFIIPKTYYFRTLSANGDYTSIVYNRNTDYSVGLYVQTSDLESKAAISTDNVTDDTAYYNIPTADVKLNDKDGTSMYLPGRLDKSTTTSMFVTIDRILGVYQYGNSVYYTSVATSNNRFMVLLFSVTATNNASFTLASIPLHQITIDKNNAQNEGVISTPGDGNTEPAGNNVIRNVMIAVICIMCVLVIFLIFRPTKNAKNRYELENRENANDDRYGRDDYDNNRR